MVFLKGSDEAPHHAAEVVGILRRQVVLLERVGSEIEELIMRLLGGSAEKVVVNHFPFARAVARPVVAAMRRVRVVHEKRLAPAAIGFASEEGIELLAIDRVPAWDGGFGEAEDGGRSAARNERPYRAPHRAPGSSKLALNEFLGIAEP